MVREGKHSPARATGTASDSRSALASSPVRSFRQRGHHLVDASVSLCAPANDNGAVRWLGHVQHRIGGSGYRWALVAAAIVALLLIGGLMTTFAGVVTPFLRWS